MTKQKTVYDKILTMDDEELAGEFLNWYSNGLDTSGRVSFDKVYDEILEWLRSPAD